MWGTRGREEGVEKGLKRKVLGHICRKMAWQSPLLCMLNEKFGNLWKHCVGSQCWRCRESGSHTLFLRCTVVQSSSAILRLLLQSETAHLAFSPEKWKQMCRNVYRSFWMTVGTEAFQMSFTRWTHWSCCLGGILFHLASGLHTVSVLFSVI